MRVAVAARAGGLVPKGEQPGRAHQRAARLPPSLTGPDPTIVGVVLAGGAGRRLRSAGGRSESSKAATVLGGRPLAAYPLEVLTQVCDRVAVVCKRETALADVGAAERWDEPDEPRHPLVGIVHALERAGRPVLVCAADMPFVTVSACRELVAAAREDAGGGASTAPRGAVTRSAVGAGEGGLEPLLGVYAPAALPALRAAPADAPLRATIESIDPVRVQLPGRLLHSINTPADLAAAAASLG